MLNDKSTSELISKSLAGMLTPEQQARLDSQIEGNEQCRTYAKLNKLIHDSVSDIAERSFAGDLSVGPGLSAEVRIRMKSQLRAESARLSESRMEATLVPDQGVRKSDDERISQSAVETATGANAPTTPPLMFPHSNLPHAEDRTVKTRFTCRSNWGRAVWEQFGLLTMKLFAETLR